MHQAYARVESLQIFNELYGGRTRARTWDPLIKSQVFLIERALCSSSAVMASRSADIYGVIS